MRRGKLSLPRPGGVVESGKDMFCVYIIKSLKTNKFYTGSTNDLERRLKEHNSGYGCESTKMGKPWMLVCYYKCLSMKGARILEKKVKSYKGGNAFKQIINGRVAEWSKAARC